MPGPTGTPENLSRLQAGNRRTCCWPFNILACWASGTLNWPRVCTMGGARRAWGGRSPGRSANPLARCPRNRRCPRGHFSEVGGKIPAEPKVHGARNAFIWRGGLRREFCRGVGSLDVSRTLAATRFARWDGGLA